MRSADGRRRPEKSSSQWPGVTVNCLGHFEGVLHAALAAMGVTVARRWRGHAWARCGGGSGEPARWQSTAHAGSRTCRRPPWLLMHSSGLNL